MNSLADDMTEVFPMPNGTIVVQNIYRDYRDTFTGWRDFLTFLPIDFQGTHHLFGFRKMKISGKYNYES
jgi:hypothetical protein